MIFYTIFRDRNFFKNGPSKFLYCEIISTNGASCIFQQVIQKVWNQSILTLIFFLVGQIFQKWIELKAFFLKKSKTNCFKGNFFFYNFQNNLTSNPFNLYQNLFQKLKKFFKTIFLHPIIFQNLFDCITKCSLIMVIQQRHKRIFFSLFLSLFQVL